MPATKTKTKTLDVAAMRRASDIASSLMGVLAHPHRLMILCQLTHGELCVGDIEAATGIGQPALSQQLGVLRHQGLVAARREGKFIFYSLASRESARVVTLLYDLYAEA